MSVTVGQIVFDCRNAATLAAFWSQVLDAPVDPEANEFFATVGRSSGPGQGAGLVFMFLQVPEERVGKNRLHVDLVSNDPAAEVARAIAAGAEHVADYAEYGITWTTLRDPEGNVFDIAPRPGG